MAKTRKPARSPALPTKPEVLAFIGAQNGGRIGMREIARAFGLKNADRAALKSMLRELADEGHDAADRKRRPTQASESLPAVTAAEIAARDSDGELIAVPTAWDERRGPAPRIRTAADRRVSPGAVAGIGDRVLLRLTPEIDAGEEAIRYTGRIIKVLERGGVRMLGVFRALPNGGGRVSPVDKKMLGREFIVSAGATLDARDGELVAIETPPERSSGRAPVRVRERLGALDSEKTISRIAIEAHGIPHIFPAAAIAEADSAQPAGLPGREDWRALPLVTIDPVDAKDHDDAVHAAPDPDPDNPGGFVVTVAIADVAHYVRPGSALDREALARGNSVYFPDRVVPMLPERISNDLCSLRPLEDRAALAVRMVIGSDGRKRAHSFHRVMMRSAAKLHYAQAQAAIDGAPDDVTAPLRDSSLAPLYAAYRVLKAARDAREPLDLDVPERKIILKPDGSVDRVAVPPRLDAHRLIEEFMILANVASAETLEAKRTPLIYRVHDEPALEKVNALREFLATIGIKLPAGGVLKPANFNRILARVAGTEHERIVNEVVLRTQAQAEYASGNYGHFGLALRRYAHFTSPIRRYADLIVHRALIRALKFGNDGLPDDQDAAALAEVGTRISAAERRAMRAERETVDRLIAHFLADKIGAQFAGAIAGVTRAGLFVKLDETGADGFIPASTLGRDYFRYEEAHHALVGQASGITYRLGDKVEVKLAEAAPVAGALRFEMLSEGVQGKRSRARRPERTAPRTRRTSRR